MIFFPYILDIYTNYIELMDNDRKYFNKKVIKQANSVTTIVNDVLNSGKTSSSLDSCSIISKRQRRNKLLREKSSSDTSNMYLKIVLNTI